MNIIKSSVLLILPLLIGYEAFAQNADSTTQNILETRQNIKNEQDTIKPNSKRKFQDAQSKAQSEKQYIQSKITDVQKQNVELLKKRNAEITTKKQDLQSKLSPEQLDKKQKLDDIMARKGYRKTIESIKMRNPQINPEINKVVPSRHRGLTDAYLDAQEKAEELKKQFKRPPANE